MIDDERHTQAAVETLERAGIEDRELATLAGEEGVRQVADGHHVVDVCVHGRRQCDAIVQILRTHGAHFINAYGQWTLENVAA